MQSVIWSYIHHVDPNCICHFVCCDILVPVARYGNVILHAFCHSDLYRMYAVSQYIPHIRPTTALTFDAHARATVPNVDVCEANAVDAATHLRSNSQSV